MYLCTSTDPYNIIKSETGIIIHIFVHIYSADKFEVRQMEQPTECLQDLIYNQAICPYNYYSKRLICQCGLKTQ